MLAGAPPSETQDGERTLSDAKLKVLMRGLPIRMPPEERAA